MIFLDCSICRLDTSIKAASELGIRFHPVRGGMSADFDAAEVAAGRVGEPRLPQELFESDVEILADMERCITQWHDNSK